MTASAQPDINAEHILAASIQHAIDDLLSGADGDRKAAFRWLFVDHDIKPMTFLWCCAVLGRDPVRVRERLYRERPALIHSLQFDPDSWNIQDLRSSRRPRACRMVGGA